MQELQPLLDATLADPLRNARENIAPIGYVGFDFPLDIQLATLRPCCHLPWRKGIPTPRADQWLESSFPGWARSILESWFEDEFDIFASVVFTRGDDAAQRLYYYVCELQRRGVIAGPQPLMLDVACIPRETSVDHCAGAIRKLLIELGINDEELRAGIGRANQRRSLFQSMVATRPALGHCYENIARAVLFHDIFSSLRTIHWPNTTDLPRVLLAGSAPPDDFIHRTIETVGWNVVGEFHSRSLQRYGAPILEFETNPVSALARSINQNTFTVRAFGDRAEQLVAAARQVDAKVVVLWITEEDESLAWHVASQRAALEAAGIAHLVLTRRRWDGADSSKDEIRFFLERQISEAQSI